MPAPVRTNGRKPDASDWKRDLYPYLPQRVNALLSMVQTDGVEELRLRANRPIQLVFGDGERILYGANQTAAVTQRECEETLLRFAAYSLYAHESELGQGFITVRGGYRVGVCGACALSGEGEWRICGVTSLNIRVSRAVVGAAKKLMPFLADKEGRARSMLIVSPPGCGKTTLLRDVARALSDGLYGAKPARVGLVDERCELCGAVGGEGGFDVGIRTDVLTGMPRGKAMRLMLRTLAPNVIVTDELGAEGDAEAAFEAINGGVQVVTSAHAGGLAALLRRRAFAEMFAAGVFSRVVLLGRSRGVGTIERVWRMDGETVFVTEEQDDAFDCGGSDACLLRGSGGFLCAEADAQSGGALLARCEPMVDPDASARRGRDDLWLLVGGK